LSEEEGNREEEQYRRRGFGARNFPPKPVKVGDEVQVTISEVSKRGDGVTRIQGYVVFVPNAKQGDSVKIKITQVRPNYAIGEII
jgi:predicted RNA-binding protein with TRAM domain